MSFYDGLLINIILLLFPIFIYLLYVSYSNNFNKKKNCYIFDIINITSVYLLIRYRLYFSNVAFLLLVNIPLILSFMKKRYGCALIISIAIVIYYNYVYGLPLVFTIIEYIVYYIFFSYFNTKGKKEDFFLYTFIFLKGIVLSFEILYLIPTTNNFWAIIFQIFLLLTLFYFIAILVILLLNKGEEFLSLNKVLKELEKEKELRNSLFKITHEVKNPIAVCKGYLDMMDYNNIDKAKKYNNIIKMEINRTLNIMDDFLNYTKIKVTLEEIDIIMLLEDTISIVDSLLKDKKIKLKTNICKEEIIINGDYERLKQVFINLLKNSIEAIEENGKIFVSFSENKKKIIIIIEDNGIGMSKETLKQINNTFFTTKNNGTGLGVPLSTEIIELHNGKIKYESKEGKGTKVTIVLHK